MNLKDQIDEIIDTLSTGGDEGKVEEEEKEVVEEQETDEVEEPVQDDETEEEENVEEEEKDSSEEEEDVEEEGEEDEEGEEEGDEDASAIDLMRSVINDMVKMFASKDTEVVQQQVAGEEEPTLTDEELALAINSPDEFKKVLAKHEQKVVQKAMKEMLPKVMQTVMQQIEIQQKVNDFYTKHSELKPYKEFVSMVAKVVAKEHPDWNVDKVLDTSAKITKEKLMLGKKKTKTNKARVKGTATRKPKPKLTPLEQEILELIT